MGAELTVAHIPCITTQLVGERQTWEGGTSGVKVFVRSNFTSRYAFLTLLVVNSVNTSN